MDLNLLYLHPSGVTVRESAAELCLAPDLRRPPVFLEAALRDPVLFRDALLTLHDLVISDFDHRLEHRRWVLDPVVTVAREEVFWEAFSQDESSYGRLSVKAPLLAQRSLWQRGTTNVDFTPALAEALAAIRSTTTAGLRVDPQGFGVTAGGAGAYEKKVKVPDSWLRGFLNVQAAMCFPTASFRMTRADLRNLLAFLHSHREREGPRSMVFHLCPGQPVEVVFEPWDLSLTLAGSKCVQGTEERVRVWGRRRLALLNRLAPRIQGITVQLGGSGFPSFWTCDLGMASFTLGISGWTSRPFRSAGLHLALPWEDLSNEVMERVAGALREAETLSPAGLAFAARCSLGKILSAAAILCRQGRAMFDLETGVYRWRDLLGGPVSIPESPENDSREAAAADLVKERRVSVLSEAIEGEDRSFRGMAQGENGKYPVAVTLDRDGRILDGDCGCAWFSYNHLRSGPCKHILALRLAAVSGSGAPQL